MLTRIGTNVPLRLRFWFYLLYVLCLLSFPLQGTAQSGANLSGRVEDATGAVIPKAQITLQSSNGKKFALSSDAAGKFHITNLPAGNYVFSVAFDGFETWERSVTLLAHQSVQQNIVLKVMKATADVTVSAGDQLQISTDADNNQSATVVDRDALDRLPVLDGDYLAMLSRLLSTDAMNTDGVSLIVNGAVANGPGVSASGIQSIKINQNPYTALYAAPGRARIEITTKGGTENFHGSANLLIRHSLFDARNAFALSKPPERRFYLEGAVTGPLRIAPRTTFLVTGNHDNNRQQAFVLASTPGGTVQQSVLSPTDHDFYSARVFHVVRMSDQFWAGYSYERRDVRNVGVGGTTLPEAGTNTHFFEHEINAGHTAVLSPRLLNQFRFLIGKVEHRTTSLNALPQIIVSGAFTGGGAQADAYRTENHVDGTDIVTYTRGKQEFKFGIDIPDISRRGYVDKTNIAGTYTFASIADYLSGTPSLYVAQRGQPRVVFWEKVFAGIFEDTVRLSPRLSIAAGVRYYFQNYFHDVPTNVAPRFSFAYAPSRRGRTILRGGAGLFYDKTGPSPISDLKHFDGTTLRRYIVSQPSYPFSSSGLANIPTSLARLDPRARIPSTLQWSIGVEEQIAHGSTLSLSYLSTRGMNLFRSIDANAPTAATSPRPNPSLGQVRLIQPEGYAKADALEISFRGHLTHYFSGQVQYLLSKTYNNTQGILYFPGDSHNPANDWARSDNDRHHKFDMLGTFTERQWFSLGTAVSLYSGLPVNVLTGSDDNGDGIVSDRPNGISRNTIHGPGYIGIDTNLTHDFFFAKEAKHPRTFSLSISSFNVLNHLNAPTYIGVVTSPYFDKPTSSLPPRRFQMNMQFKF